MEHIVNTITHNATVSTTDIVEWPILQGINRIASIEIESESTRDVSVDIVMNFCKMEDWKGTNQTLAWLSAPSLQPYWPWARLFVYLVQQPHCDPKAAKTVSDALGNLPFREVHIIKYFSSGSDREEQSAYFLHMYRFYHSLGDWIFFTHPDANEHLDESFSCLVRVLRIIVTGSDFALNKLVWFPLSQQLIYQPQRVRTEKWAHVWSLVFIGQTWDPQWNEHFAFYEGSQHIVQRKMVTKQSKEFWKRLALDSYLNGGDFSGEIEAMWHVLMGQRIDCTWRESDTSLPLALRIGLPVSAFADVV